MLLIKWGGGGQNKQSSLIFKIIYFPSFLFNLFKIIQLHKNQKYKYNEIIEIFPSLKYPPLESCKDYQDSLSYKYHLAYLLGEALSKTNKVWYKGSYFTLHKKIQKAKEKYQEISYITKQLKTFNRKLYQKIDIVTLANSSQKVYSLLQDYKDYQPLLQTLFLNFSFFMQYSNEILEWLNSKDFQTKYLDTNHPYPPLLNPNQLTKDSKNPNLSYENIAPELAWDLNLPLPPYYGFIFLSIHGCGGSATLNFFNECQIKINHRFANNKEIYLINYKNLINKENYCAIWTRAYGWENDHKLYYLITHNVPLLCIVRDPISLLKPYLNHLNNRACHKSPIRKINLTYDYDTIMPPLEYAVWVKTDAKSAGKRPQITGLEYFSDGNHNVLNKRIQLFSQNGLKNVRYLDFSSISVENGFDTFCYLAKELGFNPPTNRKKFQTKLNGNDRHLYFPFSLFLHKNDIENMYKVGGAIHLSTTSLNNPESIEIIVTLSNDMRLLDIHYRDITNNIFGDKLYKLPYKVMIITKASSIDKELFLALKVYMIGYMETLEYKENEELKFKIDEKQLLKYFKENKAMREAYKNVFNEDYQHLKANRPDIVESWKYYQEFVRMCEGEE